MKTILTKVNDNHDNNVFDHDDHDNDSNNDENGDDDSDNVVMLTMIIEIIILFRSKWFKLGRIAYLFVNGKSCFDVCRTDNDLSTN